MRRVAGLRVTIQRGVINWKSQNRMGIYKQLFQRFNSMPNPKKCYLGLWSIERGRDAAAGTESLTKAESEENSRGARFAQTAIL